VESGIGERRGVDYPRNGGRIWTERDSAGADHDIGAAGGPHAGLGDSGSVAAGRADQVNYKTFVAGKRLVAASAGFDLPDAALHPALFPFQRDVTRWALRKGRAAILAGTGLGKTAMQAQWAHHVARHTGGDVLILAPLAVAQQTVREGVKFGVGITHCREADDVRPGVNITNYERAHLFALSRFAGVVLDEASRIKHHDTHTRIALTEAISRTPYRLECTATPAPNDYMELGTHAEFLGVMSRAEMLSMFFVHDGGSVQDWRLKGHAQTAFWRWLASWAAMFRMPSDLGYEDGAFVLPPLQMHEHRVESAPLPGMLFAMAARTLAEQRAARRVSIADRVRLCADIVNSDGEAWVVWCDLNDESEVLCQLIPDAVEIRGSHSAEVKEARLIDFSEGRTRVLVTKPSIAGHGLNWQHCARVAFVGLSHSWEQYYQAIRRCWRFGQKRPVECHLIISEAEGAVLANLQRKEVDADRMITSTVVHMRDLMQGEIRSAARLVDDYTPTTTMQIPAWVKTEGVCDRSA
jgi:hypothetical protein